MTKPATNPPPTDLPEPLQFQHETLPHIMAALSQQLRATGKVRATAKSVQ